MKIYYNDNETDVRQDSLSCLACRASFRGTVPCGICSNRAGFGQGGELCRPGRHGGKPTDATVIGT